MRRKLLLILSSALLCSGECIQVGPRQFGRVDVSAYSMLGERLSPLDIDLIEVGTHKSMKSKLKGAVATKLPYGTYVLRVSAPGFRRAEREFRLDQPESSVRIQLSVAVECGGVAQVRGGIHPASADRELWVKLVPLRGVGGSEARVGRDGSFLVGGLEDGQYLFLVVDGTAIVHTAMFAVPRSSPLDVDLAKN